MTDEELYRRGVATLLAAWETYASCASGAALHRRDGVAAAVFPHGPAREIYNNAVLERAEAIDLMESLYAAAGVQRYAVWVHERDEDLRAALGARGYRVAESTRAMGRTLADLPSVPPALDLAPPRWREHLRIIGVARDLLDEPPAVRVAVARDGTGAGVATAHTLDHDGDCGIYNVGTVAHARRRGLGGALTARLLHDAAGRGCTTAGLQASPMAEGIYAAAGFRDLGRILEHVPRAAVDVRWHEGPRAELRALFALAEDSEAQLDGYLDAGRVLVAVDDDGAVVGHLQLADRAGEDRTIEIITMAVAEDRQGQGIGRTLVRRAIAEAAGGAGGAATLLVSTAAADVGNLRFYQRLGFRMLRVERDAFTAAEGYADGIVIDGIPLRDRVWLSLTL